MRARFALDGMEHGLALIAIIILSEYSPRKTGTKTSGFRSSLTKTPPNSGRHTRRRTYIIPGTSAT